ncbi:MAG: acyltransferase [Planctomycetota bacterium]
MQIPRIHPTAIVEDGVELGDGTRVWDHAHLRGPCTVGRGCIVGGKTYVAYGVTVGDLCKLNASVYICNGVTLERGVMVGAGATFTNDRFPRACNPELTEPYPSAPDEHTECTLVREGATLGARVTVGPGLTIGRFAMIGMASVVTRDVGDFHLVVGSPSRPVGVVCRCGPPIWRGDPRSLVQAVSARCEACGRGYRIQSGGTVQEIQE